MDFTVMMVADKEVRLVLIGYQLSISALVVYGTTFLLGQLLYIIMIGRYLA